VFPVKYELGFYIPEDAILHSHYRENLKSYMDLCGLCTCSTSFSQLDSSTWNIDLQELEYNPSKKDLTDAKIHHLLAEELCKPYRRVRELCLC
jgi:hypothetical protein